MYRDDVLEIIDEARKHNKIPDLNGADLSNVALDGANLTGVQFFGANLYRASLRWADLTGADFRWANLRGAKLYGANLRGAKLYGADLRVMLWSGFYVDGLHPYRCLLIPTPEGWTVTIGCWTGTVAELRTLIAGDQWPEASGDEIIRLRPLLVAFCDMCDVHMAAHPTVIDDLAEIWTK